MHEQFARVGKALANPARLELTDLLAQGERSVAELAGAAGVKMPGTFPGWRQDGLPVTAGPGSR